jgi:hypothetical protein
MYIRSWELFKLFGIIRATNVYVSFRYCDEEMCYHVNIVYKGMYHKKILINERDLLCCVNPNDHIYEQILNAFVELLNEERKGLGYDINNDLINTLREKLLKEDE